jgi:hypothetical protein
MRRSAPICDVRIGVGRRPQRPELALPVPVDSPSMRVAGYPASVAGVTGQRVSPKLAVTFRSHVSQRSERCATLVSPAAIFRQFERVRGRLKRCAFSLLVVGTGLR